MVGQKSALAGTDWRWVWIKGYNYLGELDVVTLLDAQIDPSQDALVGLKIVAGAALLVNDNGAATALELVAPDLAEDGSSAARELVLQLLHGSYSPVRQNVFGEDGDELLLVLKALGL